MTNTDTGTLWLAADWPAPTHIQAGTTVRTGGFSSAPYDTLNLARHVGDEEIAVEKNRKLISKQLSLQNTPLWLTQTHSNRVFEWHKHTVAAPRADGIVTDKPQQVCTVMTADCVPLLFCNRQGNRVAAVHAGWRGICRGILENAIQHFAKPDSLLVWIGPCISSQHYEVGADVYSACLEQAPFSAPAFERVDEHHWLCDLPTLVKLILNHSGVNAVYESGLCTYRHAELFYSYRRDGVTGRTASMIWMA